MRQLGKRSRVKGNKPFWAWSFVEPLAAFQTEVLEIVHTQVFCQKTVTESWLRQDSITKPFPSLSHFLFLSCVLMSEIYKNARNFIKTKYINKATSKYLFYKNTFKMTFLLGTEVYKLNLLWKILAKLIAKYILEKNEYIKITKKIKNIGRKTQGNCRSF